MGEEHTPLAGGVVIELPAGVCGIRKGAMFPIGDEVGVYDAGTGKLLTTVVEMRIIVRRHEQLTVDLRVFADLAGDPVPDDAPTGVNAEAGRFTVITCAVAGFRIRDGFPRVEPPRIDPIPGWLTGRTVACTCPAITGGIIAHRPTCEAQKRVVSGG